MAKPPPYIQRRDNRYYAVLNIPEPLRKHYPGTAKGKVLYKLVKVGNREFVRSKAPCLACGLSMETRVCRATERT